MAQIHAPDSRTVMLARGVRVLRAGNFPSLHRPLFSRQTQNLTTACTPALKLVSTRCVLLLDPLRPQKHAWNPATLRGPATTITNKSRKHPKSYPVPGKMARQKALGKRKPKLKTHAGTKKRYKLRGDGTYTHRATGKAHLQVGLRRRRTLNKKKPRVVTHKGMIWKLKRLLPHGTR